MKCQIFFSHRLDSLVEKLTLQLEEEEIDPLEMQVILVPNRSLKQWLLLEIAKRKGIAMGLKIVEIEEILPPPIHSLAMSALIYNELKTIHDPEILAYLSSNKRRIFNLTEELSSLFFTYLQYGVDQKSSGWQQALFQKLFPGKSLAESSKPLICFGIDFLPPAYWDFLFKAPSLSVYLFSPCLYFWEDLCSDRERKRLHRFWKKRKTSIKARDQLDSYLREGPRNLANWGKIGRETLKNLNPYDFEIDELYPMLEPTSLLKTVQFNLLTFQETIHPQIDDSIKLFLTGSSRLKEIECVRDEIVRLKMPYAEISVLAPNIEPYVPLIQYVFGEIPYRISGFDIASQSSFRQGVIRLIKLGRWDVEEVLTLFETPSFYRKQGWKKEQLETIRTWAKEAKIHWGIDPKHRNELLFANLGKEESDDLGSWEKGIDFLLRAIVYYSDLQIDVDLFEECVSLIEELKNLSFKGEKNLSSWAEKIESAAARFLEADPNDEADNAYLNAFSQFLSDLRSSEEKGLFPLELIERFLLKPCFGQMHASHLHAVRFSSIDEASLLPAKALFLIGMDEEQFPKVKNSSSLDLLKGSVPEVSDLDRYHFLQALFSAEEVLRISYGHLSAEEGKPVGPSLLVQELLNRIDLVPAIYQAPPLPSLAASFPWPKRSPHAVPKEEVVIPISDLKLLARNPWKFYLQKTHAMYVDQELEEVFALQKGIALRAAFEGSVKKGNWPLGPFGKVLDREVEEKSKQLQEQLLEWGVKPFTLVLRQNCLEPQLENGEYTIPCIEFKELKVKLVGQIPHVSEKGLISLNDDSLSGSLKIWPEALIVAVALKESNILMLKNGKIKPFNEAEKNLKAFLEYYFMAVQAPSPLLSDWADSFLRKGKWEKKCEDPLFHWVSNRVKLPSSDEMKEDWGAILNETFQELATLYPTRGKNHAAL
jgi:exodeoxyribonuclease V gamma subunit